jgi:hypothetical protein
MSDHTTITEKICCICNKPMKCYSENITAHANCSSFSRCKCILCSNILDVSKDIGNKKGKTYQLTYRIHPFVKEYYQIGREVKTETSLTNLTFYACELLTTEEMRKLINVDDIDARKVIQNL